jgi:hypothetical protein
MQTFLSEYTFKASVQALDNDRLNKQLLEARQILKILVIDNPKAGWFNHPAVRQWDGYIPALFRYCKVTKDECKRRSIKYDVNWDVILDLYEDWKDSVAQEEHRVVKPYWYRGWQADSVVTTHRARLHVKQPKWYKEYKPFVKPARELVCCGRCNYFWPSHYLKHGGYLD